MMEFGKLKAGVNYVERAGAYGVIRNESGIFAIVRKPDGLFLPGGGLHSGESPEEALRREVIEETGYESVILNSIGAATQFTRKYRKIGHFFLARLTGKVMEPTEDDHELVWLSGDDAIRQMKHEYHAWAIRKGHKGAAP